MDNAVKTLEQLKQADKMARLAMRKNGPKSYKRGQGALIKALSEHDGATRDELVDALNADRGTLKDIVLKAQRNGYVTMENIEGKKAYTVKLTEEGRNLAAKRNAANEKAAQKVVAVLTAEEQQQLDALTAKLIAGIEEQGINAKKKGHKAERNFNSGDKRFYTCC